MPLFNLRTPAQRLDLLRGTHYSRIFVGRQAAARLPLSPFEQSRPALGVYIAAVTTEIGFTTEIAFAMPKAVPDGVLEANPINIS
jgi:hypothetical protein